MIRIESSLSPISSSRMKHKMKSQNLEDSWRGSVFNASPRRALQKRESGVTESPFDLNPNLVLISETNVLKLVLCCM